jgi:hypothetical protein
MFVSDHQAEICCTSEPDSIASSSRSTSRQRRRRALDDRHVPADLDNQHLGAGVERLVLIRLGDEIDVPAARDRHPHLAALRARHRQQQLALAADQRGGAANLSDRVARERAEGRRRAQPRRDASAASAGPPTRCRTTPVRPKNAEPKLQKRSPNSDSSAEAVL